MTKKTVMFVSSNSVKYDFIESHEVYPGWIELKNVDFKLKSLIEEYEDAKRQLAVIQNQIDDILDGYL